MPVFVGMTCLILQYGILKMTIDNLRLIETVPPAVEPVSLAEAKAHLRVAHDSDDDLIAAHIAAARQMCEQHTGCAFINRTFKLYLDRWSGSPLSQWWDGVVEAADTNLLDAVLMLPKPPLQSVTAIRTYDAGGVASVFSASGYLVDAVSKPGRIVLADGASVPSPLRKVNGVEIEFIAGYGASASFVPQVLRQAVLQLVAYLYENRGDDPAAGLQASGAANLLRPYRLTGIGGA